MDIQTISMDKKEARKAYLEYRDAVKARRDKEDEAIARGYKELSKGKRLLNIHDVFANVKCDDLGRPLLAIAPAREKFIYCEANSKHGWFYWKRGRWNGRNPYATRSQVSVPLPEDSKRREKNKYRDLVTPVPSIPPALRPLKLTSKHFILWEVDEWGVVPGDPMLLKHLGGALYVVLAIWDLTPLEKAVLSETRSLS